jgi:hypothetical protein
MPVIDVLIPEDALKPKAETRLLTELTDILLRAEGFDPSNQSVGWAKAAPTYRLIHGAKSAVPTSNAAAGTAEHGPCPSSTASAAFAHDAARLAEPEVHVATDQFDGINALIRRCPADL